MKAAIRSSAEATATLAGGLRTSLPALFGIVAAPWLLLVLPLLPEAVRPIRSLADAEREHLTQRLGYRIPSPYRYANGSRRRGFRAVADNPALRRDLAWLLVHGTGGTVAGLIAVVLWPAIVASVLMPLYWWLFPPGTVTAVLVEVHTWTQALTLPFAQAVLYGAALYWLVPLAARGRLRLAEALLAPSGGRRQTDEIERLARTRTEALESHGAELRRIERDLHDGVQAELVSVSVRLGLIERALSVEPATAVSLVRQAQTGIEDSLKNLRGVIRGIYPPILADRGLGGAVHALAGGLRIPVIVRAPDDLLQLAAPVEAAAYFAIAESLTNVTRHSDAEHVEITVEHDRSRLRVVVRDDGRGGAEQNGGTGLLGIRRRMAALDGSMHIASPAGGGTTIEVSLPCG